METSISSDHNMNSIEKCIINTKNSVCASRSARFASMPCSAFCLKLPQQPPYVCQFTFGQPCAFPAYHVFRSQYRLDHQTVGSIFIILCKYPLLAQDLFLHSFFKTHSTFAKMSQALNNLSNMTFVTSQAHVSKVLVGYSIDLDVLITTQNNLRTSCSSREARGKFFPSYSCHRETPSRNGCLLYDEGSSEQGCQG